MLSKKENKNLLKGVDYAKGESKSVTNFLETKCPKCNHKIEYRLAIRDVKNVEEYIEQLKLEKQELEEKNDKYLQKLVYALTPTTHALDTDNNNAFKQIIADNIDLETCKIRRKLKEFWGVDKY